MNPLVAGLAGVAGAAAARRRTARGRSLDLRGSVALVTGASRGLGYALAEELGGRGARLVICARDAEHLEGARAALAARGADVLAQPCDVGDRRQVTALVDAARARFGQIDVLVNNAGIIAVGPVPQQRLEDYERLMAVMFWGVVHPTLAVLDEMRARGGGRIVNITSIGGYVSAPHLVPYNCAKFAAVGFSEGLRAELAADGVLVTTVVPGLMRTGSHRNAWFKGRQEAEYAWFANAAASRLTAISARKAARRVVDAAARGDAHALLGPLAHVAVRLHGLAPATTVRMLSLVSRMLPGPAAGGDELAPGYALESAVTRTPLTAPGRKAVVDLRQDVEPSPPGAR